MAKASPGSFAFSQIQRLKKATCCSVNCSRLSSRVSLEHQGDLALAASNTNTTRRV